MNAHDFRLVRNMFRNHFSLAERRAGPVRMRTRGRRGRMLVKFEKLRRTVKLVEVEIQSANTVCVLPETPSSDRQAGRETEGHLETRERRKKKQRHADT